MRSIVNTMTKFSTILRRSIRFTNQNFENSEHFFNSIDQLMKKQNENFQSNLNEQLIQTKGQIQKLKKNQRFKIILIQIIQLKNNFNVTNIDNNKRQKISNNVNTAITMRRRIVKSKKISIYHEKIIKKHLNFVRNITIVFRMIFEKFFIEKSRIVFAMQFLTKKIKKILI